MLFEGGFSFLNFLVDAFAIVVFIAWLWLFITVAGDLFSRHDVSGWVKAIWIVALILFSYLSVLVYLITQGRGMAERRAQQVQAAREQLRSVVGFSVADELAKLGSLKASGSISAEEFDRLRAKLLNA